jgi:hypothetical protein
VALSVGVGACCGTTGAVVVLGIGNIFFSAAEAVGGGSGLAAGGGIGWLGGVGVGGGATVGPWVTACGAGALDAMNFLKRETAVTGSAPDTVCAGPEATGWLAGTLDGGGGGR